MKLQLRNRKDYRVRRHLRLRHKIKGTAARPRLAVYVSNCHLYAQFVDDDAARTLACVSTVGTSSKVNCETARALGEKAAAAAREAGIQRVVVDRGGFRFHGRVKALVDAAVGAGLSIRTREPAVEEAGKESQ